MRKFLSDLLTESNNHTFSLPRVALASGLVTIVAAAASAIWRGAIDNEFYVAFGGGIAALTGGCAAGAKITPEAPKDPGQ